MNVSFTISDKENIYRPQQEPGVEEEVETIDQDQDFNGGTQPQSHNQEDPTMIPGSSMHPSSALAKSYALFESTVKQLKALGPSFSLNLFPNGFIIGNTEEFFHDVPENLIPYNLQTDTILSEVERGRLPPGIVDDMHCKYVNGTVLCEIRDYRIATEFPIIDEVPLKMGLENVVRNISSMSPELSYEDRLKFESMVVKNLHPYLHLDPTPALMETIPMAKIDLRIDWGRNRREMDDISDENLVEGETRELGSLEHEKREPIAEEDRMDPEEQQYVANQDVEACYDSS